MRSAFTFFVIGVMSALLLFVVVSRSKPAHRAPAEEIVVVDAGVDEASAPPPITSAVADAATVMPASSLKVAVLGWEYAAPAVRLTKGEPRIHVTPESSLAGVATRLARGSDPAGIDVAILPLPAFVVAYERLRALDPRIFAVVGYSRGREEVRAAPGALLSPPPAGEEVNVVAFAPGTAEEASNPTWGSESATMLGLFALDLVGVAGGRVRFVAPAAPESKRAFLAALTRGSPDDRKLAFSTADASRLVPIVVVATKATIDRDEGRLHRFLRDWLGALGATKNEGAAVAQALAKKEGIDVTAEAPEPLAILERLGQVEAAAPETQGEWQASGSASLATIVRYTWQLARGSGLTAIPAPEPLPIDTRIAAKFPAPPARASDTAENPDAGMTFGSVPAGSTPLIVVRADATYDASAVAERISLLAGIFERSTMRVSAKGGEKAARAIALVAHDRFAVPSARLATSKAIPPSGFATIEILASP